MRVYFLLLTIAVIIVLFLFCRWQYVHGDKIIVKPESNNAYLQDQLAKYMDTALRYHGAQFAFLTDKSEWYFDRDGEGCKVFTDGCIQSVTGGRYGNFKELRKAILRAKQ